MRCVAICLGVRGGIRRVRRTVDGSRFAAPFITSTLVPACTSTSPILVVRRARRKFDLIGLSKRSISSIKAGIFELSSRSCSCKSGRSASISIARLSRSIVVPWPAANMNVATRATSIGSGVEPSGNFASASSVRMSSRGSRRRSSTYSTNHSSFTPTKPLRSPLSLLAVAARRNRSRSAVGHAQQVGNRVERERKVVVNDDLALALRDEAVELLIGKTPQKFLVVLELLRREQPV